MNKIEVVVGEEQAGLRIDQYISQACSLSRAAAQRLLQEGHVLVNGEVVAKSWKLQEGDSVGVEIPLPKDSALVAQDIPLNIVYEDAHLLVVNKPKGMVVHPAAGNPDGTLVNALLYRCKGTLSGIGGEIRPGIVHRIDKDTSGLLVVAKDDKTHQGLAEQFAAHSIIREYHAVVYGSFRADCGEVNAPIGRSRQDRKKMTVTSYHSKEAVTTYQVVANYVGFSHLSLRLKTGRTHQIRVHMAEIGHPLAGDVIYGPKKRIKELNGQCLHAKTIGFVHPATQQYHEYSAPLPDYFTAFLHKLGGEASL